LLTGAHEQDATRASPEGLPPSVSAPADQLIALFADKTISPHELTVLSILRCFSAGKLSPARGASQALYQTKRQFFFVLEKYEQKKN
jgi:hypothetical protein